jgi:hypothetical protein
VVKVPPLAVPQLGSRASSGRAWQLWAARPFQEEAGPLGAQPLPRVLELATSRAAHFPASDHSGKSFDESHAKSLGLAIVAQIVGATLATLFASTVGGDAIAVSVPGANDGAGELVKSSVVEQHGQRGPLAVPGLGSCASSECAWRLRPTRHSDEEASSLGALPLPRVFEVAASEAVDFPAFGPSR